MSDVKMKARVTLLNETTGEEISEVEIVTSSDEIFYNNNKPLLKDIGKLKKGMTFENYSLGAIVDNLLYEDTPPVISSYILSNGDADTVFQDISIAKALGSTINPFTIAVNGIYGSEDSMAVTINISSPDGSNKSETKVIERYTPDQMEFSLIFEIPEIKKDTDIRIDAGIAQGPVVKYRFVSPVYVGWITPKVINRFGNLVRENTEHYLQQLIEDPNSKVEKRYVEKSNQLAMVVEGTNYNTREKLNPFILIPQSWDKLKAIVDMNGNNITNSFARGLDININNVGDKFEKYIAYISRQTFDIDEEFIRAIQYVVDKTPMDVNMDKYDRFHTPLLVGYSVRQPIPLDERFYRETYGELLRMRYPYPGLQTYVKEINTTFRFENGHWTPIGNKLHIIDDWEGQLTPELGGWDDIAIDANSGRIYKKRYNNMWERWGVFNVDLTAKKVKIDIEEEVHDE